MSAAVVRLPERSPRVGIVMMSAVGDAVHVLPLLTALKKQKDLYRSCYGKALAVAPGTIGTVRVKVVVRADGTVDRVDVIGGSLRPSPLIQCSVAKTKTLRGKDHRPLLP